MADLAETVVRLAADTTGRSDSRVAAKLSACVLVGLFETCRTLADGDRRLTTTADPAGTAETPLEGLWSAPPERAIPAGSYLMHYELRDDSYRTAFHPGQIVIWTALSVGREVGATGREMSEAMLFAYDISCNLAEYLLPEVSSRGWRITSLLAPVAAAAAASHLLADASHRTAAAISAVRLASSSAGGGLDVVASGDDWRIQPGLAAIAGVAAARMAAGGYRAEGGNLEAPLSAFSLASGSPRIPAFAGDRILGVSFKTANAPMFAQGVIQACRRVRPTSTITDISIHVSPFTAGYAGSGRTNRSVADIAGLVVRNQEDFGWPNTCGRELVRVAEDPRLADLQCRMTVRTSDGREHAVSGDGDTSCWGWDQAADFCRSEYPGELDELVRAVQALPGEPSSDNLARASAGTVRQWREATQRGGGTQHSTKHTNTEEEHDDRFA